MSREGKQHGFFAEAEIYLQSNKLALNDKVSGEKTECHVRFEQEKASLMSVNASRKNIWITLYTTVIAV